jgi:Rrf2 family cysteine metabolism transcriptional repressor
MMELSTKGRYATRIMVYLAAHDSDQPVPKKAIAKAEDISPDYAEQLLIKLKAGGLVRSHRGVQGGFSLSQPANEITVREVLEATEGPIEVAPCDEDQCPKSASCVTRPVWREVEDEIRKVLDKTTIGLLAQRMREANGEGLHSFSI